ncbi:hypothetical protein KKA15_04045 [Patescibacteria group bacterium]|nr:hypothetical protein [Patescibacteria group bacterium]
MQENMIMIEFNDVTLRESGQVEGGGMSVEDQEGLVDRLMRVGTRRIEIGFPGSSDEQLKNCIRIRKFVDQSNCVSDKPLLSGLARGAEIDIDAVKKAGCDICHIVIPVSDQLVMAQFNSVKYGNTKEGKQNFLFDLAVKCIKYAKRLGFKHIEYSPEDAARASDVDYLCRLIKGVIDAGATVVNIPDTTGLCIGNEFGDRIAYIFDNVSNIGKAQVSVHCHNDSDHSTHNALCAIRNGATIIEGTFFGLGERSGMTKFEAILLSLFTRRDVFANYAVCLDASMTVEIVNFVATALGMQVPRHHVVAGIQNIVVSSGMHQGVEAGAAKQEQASPYYSWKPDMFGHTGVEVVLNQSSSRKGLRYRLEQLGFDVTNEQLDRIYQKMTKLSDARAGARVTDHELITLAQDVVEKTPFRIEVVRCQAIGGRGTIPNATIIIEAEGKQASASMKGNGTFHAVMLAVFEAAKDIFPELKGVEIVLKRWQPVQVGEGAEAIADLHAAIGLVNEKNRIYSGRDADVDTIQATAQGYANCISWLVNSLRGNGNSK